MYALEAEPEQGGRMKRLGVGGAIALALGVGFVYAANNIAPMQKALAKVVPFAIVDVPPPRPKKAEPEPPPPVDVPKPKPKAKPEPQAAAPQPATPPPPNEAPKPEQPPGPEAVGLDSDSFGSGGSGPGFHAGSTQMGVPTGGRGGGGGGTGPVDAPKIGPKLVEAKARPGNREPSYPDSVRKLNIEGLVIVEADIDAHGKVTRAVVRKKLDPKLDEEALKAVQTWGFEPATLQGQAVASTKFLRFRFQLN